MPAITQAPYSSGAQIMALIQDLCNDPQGQLYTPTFCIEAINSASRWIGRELRNRGKMTLVEDEYEVTIPAVLVSDPMQQVNLTFTGINGNVTAANTPTLPDDLIEPLVLWQRPATVNKEPQKMRNWTAQGGLPKNYPRFQLEDWEWRADQICFIGALEATQVLIRYSAVPLQFSLTSDTPPLVSGTLGDIDAVDAVAYYAASQLTPKRGGFELGQQYRAEAETLLNQLATDVTRQAQFNPTRMRPYGGRMGHRGGSRNL